MPTQKKKLKKSKIDNKQVAETATTTNAMKIKSEPLDIKPLSSFIDDRVELIRQAFSCLKPKEVKCLVPDTLQGKSIEFIQEQCLDEVLGISTKRLLSIINSTKCPTDTESSDDGEDKIEEHISLDEISSDSDVDIKNVRKVDKKSKKLKISDTASNEKVSKNGGKKSEKEMTVLELLELQARARAIRSQLALEPITKIELDSDQEAGNESNSEAAPSRKKKENSCNEAKMSTSSTVVEQPKRVRLKRNFRIRQVGDEEQQEETEADQDSSKSSENFKRTSPNKSKDKMSKTQAEVSKSTNEQQKETKSRDSSPEVIPLIPSPETLCISSESESEETSKKQPSIFVENVKELEKEMTRVTDKPVPQDTVENEEPEEGEISEEEKSLRKSNTHSINTSKSQSEHEQLDDSIGSKFDQEELDYEIKTSDSEPETSANCNEAEKKNFENAPENTVPVELMPGNDKDNVESESDDSMSDVEKNNQVKKQMLPDDDDSDIVEIHDSSDETLLDQKMAEDDQEKSWNSRWLESNRVAKVMATSRLGNKVRDKLKKKKKKKQEEEEEARKPPTPEPVVETVPTSTAEVGSVEHYKELVAKVAEAEKQSSAEGSEKEASEHN
ncbi:glutamic acid-rich protein [Uranotaenia lowii]|uniref:glutamic acid-rich protein n=1 Tax=Uranotaenia lowii TaxID=190385 RepID=UPI00247AFDEC|nr:glutamic acid-rich protein [Uranotaenia lowii]